MDGQENISVSQMYTFEYSAGLQNLWDFLLKRTYVKICTTKMLYFDVSRQKEEEKQKQEEKEERKGGRERGKWAVIIIITIIVIIVAITDDPDHVFRVFPGDGWR